MSITEIPGRLDGVDGLLPSTTTTERPSTTTSEAVVPGPRLDWMVEPDRRNEAGPAPLVQVRIPARRLYTLFLAAIAALTAFHLFAALMVFQFHRPWQGLLDSANLNNESTIGTWFSSFVLAFDAVLLWWVGRTATVPTRGARLGFRALAALVALASLDEVATGHEHLSNALHSHFHTGGLLLYAWVVPAIVLVIAVAAFAIPLLRRLPRPEGPLLVAAAGTYVMAAVGLELIDSYADSHEWIRGMVFFAILAAEEAGEMFAACTVAYLLLRVLAKTGTVIDVAVEP